MLSAGERCRDLLAVDCEEPDELRLLFPPIVPVFRLNRTYAQLNETHMALGFWRIVR